MTSYKAMSYSQIVIRSCNDKRAESIFHCRRGKGLPVEIQQRARRKLRMLDAVTVIDDLKIPPSNHLQKLKGDRRGQHSIRINDQWRISFVRQHNWASEIEIVGDYGAGYGVSTNWPKSDISIGLTYRRTGILTGIFGQQAEYRNRPDGCLLHERVKPYCDHSLKAYTSCCI